MLFLFVGNSGAGKDTLMREVAKVTNAHIAKRYITRPPSPETEDFYSVDACGFEKMAKNMCVTWESYENMYGIGNEVAEKIDDGELIFANVSRTVIKKIKSRWPETKIIYVDVPIETTIKRLNERQRDQKTVRARIARAKENAGIESADFIVENKDLSDSIQKIVDYIQKQV